MEQKKFYTHSEAKDRLIGKENTPERKNYEEGVGLFIIGEAIKCARKEKKLTQEELGKLVGVQKSQISRIENGENLTFATVIKLFKAIGVRVNLEIEETGKFILC
ncbi:MAG: helix-turn-helix domain-containing protein [Culturomica sp.]|jgi:DNA-binding XRE family transcriptional regulator|nr:helix-turn-helix domain-containing protein [Culturomica sp.]